MQRKKEDSKKIDGKGLRIGIAVARFNSDITDALLQGALRALRQARVKSGDIKILRVPGSFELPLACARLAATGEYDALVALGAVIKGETDHYHFVAGEASRGIMEVMLKYDIPIGFGLLTTDTLEQAQTRAGKKVDFGASAARAALAMVSLR